MTPRAKRPSFFEESAVDQILSMMLEMMTELWVVKERVYTLEKVLDQEGIDARDKIEAFTFSDDEITELESARRKFIASILRTLETNFVDHAQLQEQVDELTDVMKKEIY